jgi:hypothetical protein
MDNFDRLVQFIDRHTHHGTQELPQIFGEGVGAEAPGVEDLDQFIDRDWLRLQGYWGERSDNWIEALIFLLTDVDNSNSRGILVQIVLLGSDESSLTAIGHVREFIDELNLEVRSQIEIKISRIISSRINK